MELRAKVKTAWLNKPGSYFAVFAFSCGDFLEPGDAFEESGLTRVDHGWKLKPWFQQERQVKAVQFRDVILALKIQKGMMYSLNSLIFGGEPFA